MVSRAMHSGAAAQLLIWFALVATHALDFEVQQLHSYALKEYKLMPRYVENWET
jgi:hypothetical protein